MFISHDLFKCAFLFVPTIIVVNKIDIIAVMGTCEPIGITCRPVWLLKTRRILNIARMSCAYCIDIGHSANDLPIALQCLDALIGKRRRQVPASRVFAFVKRLSTLALQMECHGSLALLALISGIISVRVVLLCCRLCNIIASHYVCCE